MNSAVQTAPRIPRWLKRKLPSDQDFFFTKSVLAKHRLNTICQDAKCPNVWECWSGKTATFMILGEVCTRRCGFCAVAKGMPAIPDAREPQRIAQAVVELGLRYVVITSVDRDDLPDQGAGQFRDTILAIRAACPQTRVEVLTPDFRGDARCLEMIFAGAAPNVFAHNIETVQRLYPLARRGSSYARSLALLKAAKEINDGIPVKSSIMVGMGETREEVFQTLKDLRENGVDIVTIGQYLQPSQHQLNVVEYAPLETFQDLEKCAYSMGFSRVKSGPMVRSSYHADSFSPHPYGSLLVGSRWGESVKREQR